MMRLLLPKKVPSICWICSRDCCFFFWPKCHPAREILVLLSDKWKWSQFVPNLSCYLWLLRVEKNANKKKKTSENKSIATKLQCGAFLFIVKYIRLKIKTDQIVTYIEWHSMKSANFDSNFIYLHVLHAGPEKTYRARAAIASVFKTNDREKRNSTQYLNTFTHVGHDSKL